MSVSEDYRTQTQSDQSEEENVEVRRKSMMVIEAGKINKSKDSLVNECQISEAGEKKTEKQNKDAEESIPKLPNDMSFRGDDKKGPSKQNDLSDARKICQQKFPLSKGASFEASTNELDGEFGKSEVEVLGSKGLELNVQTPRSESMNDELMRRGITQQN